MKQHKTHLLSVLVAMLFLLFMPMQALAAAATMSNLTFSDASVSGTTATMSVSGGKETTKIITITNSSENEIKLEFDYSHYSNGGTGDNGSASTTMDSPTNGTCISNENSHCIMTLQSGGYFTVTIKTWDSLAFLGGSSTYNFKMSNVVQSIVYTSTDLTVNYNSNLGTVKHGDTTIEASSTISDIAKDETLTATATTGTFLGWVDTSGKILTTSATYAVTPTAEAMTVQAVFASADTNAWFWVDSTYLTNDLNTAASLGTSIILAADGILPSGSYTIPSGDKLLIPYSSANLFRGVPTAYEFHNWSLNGSTVQPSPEPSIIAMADRMSTADTEYRRLTMAQGAHITVNGALEVSGQTDSFARGQRGAYSVIQMANNSSITVKSGATLYAYGYVRGGGTVTVESGGTVYQHMDAVDYPNAGGGGMNELNDAGVFGMRDYSFNNVEVLTTYQAGATMKAYIVITGNMIGTNSFVREFIGNSSNAVFQITSGTMTMSYVDGRQKMTVSGVVGLNGFSINMKFAIVDYKMDTAATSGLPLGRTMDMTVSDGATVTVNNSVVMYAGGTMTVDHGGKIVIPKDNNIYLLDLASDPVDNDTANEDGTPITLYGNAKLDVNGEIEVNGAMYTTYTDANYVGISSGKGTGKLTVNNVGTATTVPVRQGYKNYAAVFCNIIPVKLQNSDPNSIVETANGGANTYTYTEGFWRCATHSGVDTDHTCDVCGYVTACADTDGDSFCDICGKNLCTHESMTTTEAKSATCEDPGNYAYWYCAACQTYFKDEAGTAMFTEEDPYIIPALTHKDENPKDHICDNGCEVYQGTHADGDDNDHLCDYCNGAVEGDVCVDNDNDHNCDECGISISVCVDEGKDHKCDICGENVGIHEAAQGTHICAYCNQNASDCDYTVRGDIVTEANCVTKAVYKAKCSVCDAVSETETITGEVDSSKHTGKTDVRNAKSATCAAEGYTGDTHCSDCGVKLQNGTTTEKLTTHTYPETWTQTKAPTCTEKGSEERKCTVEGCDATETREVKELDHDWATTLTQGETTHWYNCSRCDETKDVANHNYTWTTTQEATCYQDGSKSGTCSCGATATEVIDATGEHTFSETYTTENGSHWRACTTTGCTEKTDVGTCSGGAATCTTPATCSVCGQSYGTVDENAHNWGNWEVTTPASCTAEGEEVRTCSYDSAHTETQAIKKAAHTMTHHVRVEATCVAAGNVEYWSCSGCDLNYSDENGTTKLDSVDTAINSDAHDLKNVAAQSATCIQIGWDAYQKCQREGCNYSTYVEIPKLDHTDADNDGDHLCDTDGCSEVVTTCEDTGKDHVCDSDSACNIYSTGNNAHVDSDNDHACDYGCKVSIGECKDGDDADHKCDYGCGKDNLTDHNYGTEWKCDTTNHWHECICGDKADVTAHTYSSEETKAATCTEAGEMTYTCVCGRSYTEEIKAVGHRNTVTINEKAATCGTAGYTGDTFCNDCKTTIKEGETIGATGNHSYTTKASTSVKSEATCKDVAVYWAQCDNCTAVSDTATVNGTEKAPDNHVGGTEEIPEVPATCQTAGTTAGTKCLGCNTVISGCTEIAKQACADTDSDHICNNGCDQKLSECADNDTDHDCDVCGAAMGTHEAAEGKHTCDYCGETVTQCDDSDDADHYCDVCGKMVGGHTYGTEWKTDDTNHWHECACGEKSDLANHSYDDGVVTKEPTTEAEGEMTYTCKCGYSYIETIDKLVPQGYKVTLDDRTKGAAIRDGLEDGQIYAPGHTFTVTCSNACVVAISIDGGESYKELTCVVVENKENTYQFAVPEEVNGDFKIGIVLRGDANASGTVNAQDRVRISKYRNKTAELDALEYWAADANASGTVNAQDRVRISKYRNKTATLDWKLN